MQKRLLTIQLTKYIANASYKAIYNKYILVSINRSII